MGGSAQYVFVARRLDPSTWTRIKADAIARPARQGARDRARAGAAARLPERRAGRPGRRRRRRRPLGRRALAQRRAQRSRRPGARSRRSTTGRPATRTGRASCTCASRCRASRCSSRSTCASSASCSRRSPRPAARWHAKAVTAVVLDTRTGGILAMAAAPGVPPAGYRAGNPEEWRLRAITDLLRARLDLQARDVHGRPAGGRDPAEHAVPRARRVHQDVREPALRAHDPGRALAPRRGLDGAPDPRALLQRRHDHDRREAPGPDAAAAAGSRRSASASAPASTCPASCPAACFPTTSGTARRSSTSRSARASRSRRCRWRRSTPRSPTAARGSSRTSPRPSAASP